MIKNAWLKMNDGLHFRGADFVVWHQLCLYVGLSKATFFENTFTEIGLLNFSSKVAEIGFSRWKMNILLFSLTGTISA